VLSANDPRTQAYVREYAPAIIDRTDEFNSVLSYQLRGYGKPVPKPLKKGITDALHKKYAIVKVNGPAFEADPTARVTYIEDGSEETPRSAIDRGMRRVYEQNGIDLNTEQYGTEVVDEGYVHDEYTFSKYSERDKEVSMHDVLNLVRPKPRTEERNQMFGSIAKGELSSGEAEKDHWEVGPNWAPEEVEPLREDRTWESEMSEDDDRTDAEKFRARLDDMGLMARVRNLRNMREAGIPGSDIFDYDRSASGAGEDGGPVFGENSEAVVRQHQMFPFRFYQAFRACGDVGISRSSGFGASATKQFDIGRGDLLDSFSEEWLNEAIDVGTENLPDTLENTFTAVDLSGSMDSEISGHSEMARAEIGSLFGAMLMKRDSDVGAFGDDFATISADPAARKTTPTLDIAQRIYAVGEEVGNSTNGWKALDWATKNDESYDRFVVFTDEQIWDSRRSGLFGSNSNRSLKDAWDDYTEQVNPDAHLYVIDLASYGDLTIPEGYQNVHQISGWTSNVVQFIDKFEQADDVTREIESIGADDY